MKRANLALNALFCVGLALIIGGFFLCVSTENRSPVAYMNLVVTLLLYSGIWGRFSLLYPKRDVFAERVPVMTVYWAIFFKFAIVEIIAMVAMGLCKVPFKWQIFVHLVIFFIFSVMIAVAYWAANFIRSSGERDKETIGGTDSVKSLVPLLSVEVASLGAEYSEVKTKFASIADDCNYLSGSNLAGAKELDEKINQRLTTFSSMISSSAAPAEMERILVETAKFVAMRKTMSME